MVARVSRVSFKVTETIKQPKVRTAGLHLTVQELDVWSRFTRSACRRSPTCFSSLLGSLLENPAGGVNQTWRLTRRVPRHKRLGACCAVGGAARSTLPSDHFDEGTFNVSVGPQAFTNVIKDIYVSRASRRADITFNASSVCKSCGNTGCASFLPTSHRRSFSFRGTKGSNVTLTWMARLTMLPQTRWYWTGYRMPPDVNIEATEDAPAAADHGSGDEVLVPPPGQLFLRSLREIFQAMRLTTSTGPPPLRPLQHHPSPWQRVPW